MWLITLFNAGSFNCFTSLTRLSVLLHKCLCLQLDSRQSWVSFLSSVSYQTCSHCQPVNLSFSLSLFLSYFHLSSPPCGCTGMDPSVLSKSWLTPDSLRPDGHLESISAVTCACCSYPRITSKCCHILALPYLLCSFLILYQSKDVHHVLMNEHKKTCINLLINLMHVNYLIFLYLFMI